MKVLQALKWLLFPIKVLYGTVLTIRHICYNTRIFSSKKYDIPIVCVGNLSFGGTGKTPMIEYLCRLLGQTFSLAIISRGYGRKTRGFVLANTHSSSEDIGDEPCQYVRKFPKTLVAVDSSRTNALSKISPVDAVLLDDAFQHRAVSAGLNILLTTYNKPYYKDFLFPQGTLRDTKNQAKRADIVVVTKCPEYLSEESQKDMVRHLALAPQQQVYFTTIVYDTLAYSKSTEISLQSLMGKKITLVTGIANPEPLVRFLAARGLRFKHLNYSDHHAFSKSELLYIDKSELILTTEKDFSRLQGKLRAPLYYIPMAMRFLANGDTFDKTLRDFVKLQN